MPNPAELVLDPWTGLAHKSAIGDRSAPAGGPAPTWVGNTHRRRLTVYLLLLAYSKNAARYWLRATADDPDRWLQHREYGDPAMLIQTIRAAVLGGLPRPLVDGSDDELPAPPTEEDVAARALPDELEGLLAEALDEWKADRTRIDAAVDRQEWIDQWWTDERVSMKVVEAEDDAVGLGDGIYELVNSTEKGRTRVRVHEPGFYFPVHSSDAQGDDFPDRVHLAWEWEDDDGERFVRRRTYDRRRVVALDDDDVPALDDDGAVIGATRRYAYAPDVPSRHTVVVTDATWRIRDMRSEQIGVDQFSLAEAFEVHANEDGDALLEMDLEQDFIPVIHVPNTPAIKELWGESALIRIAQLLDDLAANDTDLAVSSALVASPAITISGGAAAGAASTITTYGPGMVFRTGDGTMNVLDTSRSLDALIKMQDRLLERLSTVRQVPQSVLGRVDVNGQLAGITLLLSFGPFRAYIDDLRLPRQDKYPLLLKFVQRMGIVGGWLQGPVLDATLAFGSFLPTDTSALVAMVKVLIDAKLIGRATGMRLLQEDGIEIDSIEAELDAVRHEDFEGAARLADAVGSEQAAAEYLGVEIPEPAPQEPTQPPPGEGEPPGPGGPAPEPPSPAGDTLPGPLV